MQGIDAFHQELTGKAYAYAKPGLETVDWGRLVEVADTVGNRLRYCERKGD